MLTAGIPQQAIAQFIHYDALLLAANEQFNLTAILEPQEVAHKHFLDSLALATVSPAPGRTLDIGSGAGFPGIPLLIMHPEWDVTLLDASKKRCTFLQNVLDELHLQARICHARAEDFARTDRETFDTVTARAVAPLRVLLEYMLPLARVGGVCWAYKSKSADEEIAQAQSALKILGAASWEIVPLASLSDDMERVLVRVEKGQPTPAQYPRKAGKPEKQPL